MSKLQLLSGQVLVSHTLAASLCEAVFRSSGFKFYCVYALCEFMSFAAWPLAKTWVTEGSKATRQLLTPRELSWACLSQYLACAVVMTVCHTSGLKASQFLDYTTVLVFKSAKVPGVVLCRILMNRSAAVPRLETALSLCMMLGLVLFGMAESKGSHSKGISVWGLVLISLSLVCGSLCANLQQKVLQPAGTCRESPSPIAALQLLIFQYTAASVLMLILTALSGELSEAFAWYSAGGCQRCAITVMACVFPAYGMEAVYKITEIANATHSNAVCSARKVVTFLLSYLLYSKPANYLHLVGATCTIGAGGALQYTHGRASSKLDGKQGDSKLK